MRAVIYTNDHDPPNVHVEQDKCEAVFEFDCGAGTVRLRVNYRFGPHRIEPIRKWLMEILEKLCNKWEEFHGDK
jgi:Domain of unknown function (DUF4160)